MSRDLAIDRRGMLTMCGGAVIAAGLPGAGWCVPSPGADAALRQTLDGLAALPTPDARLQALAGIAEGPLSPVARADLLTVRFALQCDRALAALPPGADRYPLLLARACGATITVNAAERRLQAEAARLQATAARLFDRAGIPAGRTGARFRALFADPSALYSDDAAGRAAAVADMARWLEIARAALPRWFMPLPPACREVTVATLSAADLAAGKPGYRILPGPDRPGVYVVDLRDIRQRPRWSLRSVVHHELLPGHMVQMPLEALARPHPLRLHDAKAFTEGWAIYAEMLAWRGGLCAGPTEALGVIHWLLFRVMRGLVDIGIHGRGWSADRAVDALAATIGHPVYFAPFAADVGAIVAQPAQRVAEVMTSYALADGAVTHTDVRRYHRDVLATGALPMALIASFARGRSILTEH